MKFALGILLLLVGTLAVLFNLRTSYLTLGGSIGQVPVLAAAVQVPLVVLLGIGLIDDATAWFGFVWWHYLLTWLGLTLGIGMLTVWAGRLGEKMQARQASRGTE